MVQLKNFLRIIAPLGLASLVVACASKPEAPTEAQITDEITDSATVLLADRSTRELTLQRADGTRVTIVAGPEIRNFEQINVGEAPRRGRTGC